MTRREYLERYRAALLELSDITLGTYLLHFGGAYRCYRREVPPLDLGDLDLHAYLWPDLDQTRLDERVTAPAMTPRHFERMVAGVDIGRGSASTRARYDSAVLSVGQRARDLLTGKPAAWWNLTQRRIEQLEPQHEGAERYAVETERAAAAARQRADRLRGELEAARARLAELDAAGARAT